MNFIVRKLAPVVILLLFSLSAQATEKVRLQLKWEHQFQFAGYYAAKEKGYYQAAGLDVEIIQGSPNDDSVQNILDGKAEFGVGSTELLLLREKGEPVVVLAVVFQHSPLVLMTLKQDNVQTIHDLAGKNVMVEAGSSELYAYLNKEGLSLDKFTLISHGFNSEDLLDGKVDAMSTYVTDEPFELEKIGKEYLLYSPRSAGIDFYGDNLFTTDSLLKNNPEMVKSFRKASLKGWEYAMNNQEEIIQLIYSRYSKRHSIDHLRYEVSQMIPLLQTNLIEVGHMNPGRWQHIAATYAELGMLKPDFDLAGFLYDPNPPSPDLSWLYLVIGLIVLAIIIVLLVVVYIYRINSRLRSEIIEREQIDEKYRVLFMNSPDAYLILVDGVFVDCNNATEIMLRGERSQIIGQPPELISPEYQPGGKKSTEAAKDKIDEALKTGNKTFEWVHRRLDGTDFNVEVSIVSIIFDGKPALFTT